MLCQMFCVEVYRGIVSVNVFPFKMTKRLLKYLKCFVCMEKRLVTNYFYVISKVLLYVFLSVYVFKCVHSHCCQLYVGTVFLYFSCQNYTGFPDKSSFIVI